MPVAANVPKLGPCPDGERLSAFNRGLLPLEELEVIAGHVSSCPNCEALLNRQQADAGDVLLMRLRRCLGQPRSLDEPGVAALEAKAVDFSLRETPALDDRPTPAPAIESPLPSKIGNYEIINRLGRGGMGVVYTARQQPLNRLVALKCIGASAYTEAQSLSRFRVEGAAIARLNHPNVVRIYDFGEQDGLPYFSMELVEGGSLAARLRRAPLTPTDTARVLATIARAVHYAHQNQVLHRDLKPGNILLAADGTPKISDFGLAKLLDQETENTRGPMVLGTPSYMAPEQAAGRNTVVDARADVYALGAILYEALAGQPPFKSNSRAKTLDLVCTADPEPPSRNHRNVPPALEAICLKCLEKVPAKRYQTAEALADDLDRWLRGEPTLARPANWRRKAWRYVRRHKVAAAIAILLVGGSALAVYLDPDRPRRDLEAHIAPHVPLTLIGETGGPNWYHVRQGMESSRVARGFQGAFTIQTSALCLVELVHDPKCKAYRYAAEIHHEQSDFGKQVGLYFGHVTSPGIGADDDQVLASVVFHDVYLPAHQLGPLLLENKIKTFPRSLQAKLGFRILGSVGETSDHVAASEPYKPSGQGNQRWRRVEVVVTEDNMSCSLDGQQFHHAHEQKVGPIALATFDKRLGKAFEALGPNQPAMVGLGRSFAPRGALGLYLERGTASFKNVSFTPLGAVN